MPQQGFFWVLGLVIVTKVKCLESTLIVCEEVKVTHVDFRLQGFVLWELLHTLAVELSDLIDLSFLSVIFLLTEFLVLGNELVKECVFII